MRERRVNGAYDVVCRANLQAQQFPRAFDLAYYDGLGIRNMEQRLNMKRLNTSKVASLDVIAVTDG